MKYANLDLGTIEAVFNKLGGIEGAQAYLRGQNPLLFERNEHGHVIITVTGLNLTGAQEIERLEAAGYRVSDYAKSCFLSMARDSYDRNHRLVAGQLYKLALVPHKEIERDADRTTQALRELGMQKYGYSKPQGGFTPRVREAVSDKQMEEMGIYYISNLHDPIADSGGDPGVLYTDRDVDGRWVRGFWGCSDFGWYGHGTSAFPVSASNT